MRSKVLELMERVVKGQELIISVWEEWDYGNKTDYFFDVVSKEWWDYNSGIIVPVEEVLYTIQEVSKNEDHYIEWSIWENYERKEYGYF